MIVVALEVIDFLLTHHSDFYSERYSILSHMPRNRGSGPNLLIHRKVNVVSGWILPLFAQCVRSLSRVYTYLICSAFR